MADLATMNPSFWSLWLLYLFCEMGLTDSSSSTSSSSLSSSEVDQHLQMGMRLLGQGQLQDALSHFHSAIDADSSNYLSYFRRATVYLALGKAKQALPDLNQVLTMKPDFLAARIQRGSLHLKVGSLDEAHIDFENVLRRDPQNEEALHMYSVIERVKQELDQAENAKQYRDLPVELELVSSVIDACPWWAELRVRRAGLQRQAGGVVAAISDLRSAVKLHAAGRSQLLLQIAQLHYGLGEVHESLNEIRECLRLDQDDQPCHRHYTKVKKVVKTLDLTLASVEQKDHPACVASANKILKLESSEPSVRYRALELACTCESRSGTSTALKTCTEALQLERSARVLCDRADAYLNDDQFDEAIRDYQQALEIDGDLRRAKEGVDRAQKLRKQHNKRNYYRILGVKKTATKREITKAYRKLAQQWHPDNFASSDDAAAKKKAENKFIDIAAAKEVLTDPEKRKKFDSGVDPLDPESEAGRGFNPFQHGFHGFPGGGGQTFTFHFN